MSSAARTPPPATGRPPSLDFGAARCTIVIGLESSGTRFVARELSRLLGNCSLPPHARHVEAAPCGWNGESPPCWSTLRRTTQRTAPEQHYVHHLSLPWGLTCTDSFYVRQRSDQCLKHTTGESGRWFLNVTSHLLAYPQCRAVVLTRDKIFTRVSKLHRHCGQLDKARPVRAPSRVRPPRSRRPPPRAPPRRRRRSGRFCSRRRSAAHSSASSSPACPTARSSSRTTSSSGCASTTGRGLWHTSGRGRGRCRRCRRRARPRTGPSSAAATANVTRAPAAQPRARTAPPPPPRCRR
jgi:hypothetical protein